MILDYFTKIHSLVPDTLRFIVLIEVLLILMVLMFCLSEFD